jgi:hypothetical protein
MAARGFGDARQEAFGQREHPGRRLHARLQDHRAHPAPLARERRLHLFGASARRRGAWAGGWAEGLVEEGDAPHRAAPRVSP